MFSSPSSSSSSPCLVSYFLTFVSLGQIYLICIENLILGCLEQTLSFPSMGKYMWVCIDICMCWSVCTWMHSSCFSCKHIFLYVIFWGRGLTVSDFLRQGDDCEWFSDTGDDAEWVCEAGEWCWVFSEAGGWLWVIFWDRGMMLSECVRQGDDAEWLWKAGGWLWVVFWGRGMTVSDSSSFSCLLSLPLGNEFTFSQNSGLNCGAAETTAPWTDPLFNGRRLSASTGSFKLSLTLGKVLTSLKTPGQSEPPDGAASQQKRRVLPDASRRFRSVARWRAGFSGLRSLRCHVTLWRDAVTWRCDVTLWRALGQLRSWDMVSTGSRATPGNRGALSSGGWREGRGGNRRRLAGPSAGHGMTSRWGCVCADAKSREL
jgi:hypothetical protein